MDEAPLKKKQDNIFFEIYGWYGTIAIVAAYFLVSFSLISPEGYLFQILNATGALGIILISLHDKSHQSAVLNMVWLAIAIVALIKIIV